MKTAKRVLALLLACTVLAYAQGNTFTKVRYNGGSVTSRVDPKSWDNSLTVTSDMITLALEDGVKVQIPPRAVSALSYGQEAHRRVGTMIALAVLLAPVALFGLFHKTRLHYIGIQWATPDGKAAGVLLQGDKDNYRAILVALQGVSGAPVSVSESDRQFLPVGVSATVASDTGANKNPGLPAAQAQDATGTVSITTLPDGADVLADEQFYGNAPATLKLKPGKHTIRAKMAGYKEWSREISVEAGSEARLTANLEKLQ
jgi:PEGA domain